jgi:LPPG:FO 2-phospho-L-lactate transferase
MPRTESALERIVYLTGGVGGSRFLSGLVRHVSPKQLCIVVNTADDRDFFGLHVSPDLDTVLYKLSGVVSGEGWGVQEDTFFCLEQISKLGEEAWFRLGDKDLATHILRTKLLRQGLPLHSVTERLAKRFGIPWRILPMSDDPVETWIKTKEHGWVHFQEYLVKYRSMTSVLDIRYKGIRAARATQEVLEALERASLVIIGPSNPITSIGPILALRGVKALLRAANKPVVAVSPLIGGRPVKGPLDKLFLSIGVEPGNLAVTSCYRTFLKGLVIDQADRSDAGALAKNGLRVLVTDTLMGTQEDAGLLAGGTLSFARDLSALPDCSSKTV